MQLRKESLKKKTQAFFSQLHKLLITAMIFLQIILHSTVYIYDFHIVIISSSSFHGFITNQFNDLLPVGSYGRALHRYRRGQGFESRTSLNFFFRPSFRNCISCGYNLTAMIFLQIILHSLLVYIYDFHIFIVISNCSS